MLVFGDAAGGPGLGVQSVQGQDGPGKVKPGGGVLQLSDLVCLGIGLPLRAGVPDGDVEDRQQVDLAAVSADGGADGLAVRSRLGQQPGRAGPAFAARRCSRSRTLTSASGPAGTSSRASRSPRR